MQYDESIHQNIIRQSLCQIKFAKILFCQILYHMVLVGTIHYWAISTKQVLCISISYYRQVSVNVLVYNAHTETESLI